jgi:hypothetical protein
LFTNKLNSKEQTLEHFPQTQELPKLNGQFQNAENFKCKARNQALQTQLRLAHLKEGEEEIRQFCAEYMDIFKLT